ncbi:MAG TPA: hypothetical protein VGH39_15930 [Xanthobacteraceae bacterium]|jgi:hypothetical protein
METHPGHVDAISVWTWVATLAFILIAVAAVLVGTHDNLRVAREAGPAVPLVQPVLLPNNMLDARA